jgi:hypothetical protein
MPLPLRSQEGDASGGGVCLDVWVGTDTRNGGRSFWEDPTDLKVRFLDGDKELQERVIRHAQPWTEAANVGFDFRASDHPDIRVSFRGRGNWSCIGTDARRILDPARPTMNLQLTLATAEEVFTRTVLHEFGHALGLVHEHQIRPGNPIQWNEAAVIRAHQGLWSEEEVRRQILTRYQSGTFFNRSPKLTVARFDAQSIMLYPIRKEWTRNGFSVPWNTALSEGDKQFLAAVYGPPQ